MELQNNKGVLALVILFILAGGGTALYFLFKPKKEEKPKEQIKKKEEPKPPPVKGRDSLTGYRYDKNKIKDLFFDETKEDPKTTAVLLKSDEAKELIDDTMKDMQNDPDVSKLIRKKYEIGKNIISQAFNEKKKTELKKMFSLIDGVDSEDYTTLPVYGKYEGNASKLRQELKAFHDNYYKNHNLTKYRKDNGTWWFSSIGVNIVFGSSNSHNWSAHEIWAGQADRGSLNFYKTVNGHDVEDIFLIEKFKSDGNAAYVAGGTYTLVEKWLMEMSRFDDMTKEYAIDYLIQRGKIVRNEADKTDVTNKGGKGGKLRNGK